MDNKFNFFFFCHSFSASQTPHAAHGQVVQMARLAPRSHARLDGNFELGAVVAVWIPCSCRRGPSDSMIYFGMKTLGRQLTRLSFDLSLNLQLCMYVYIHTTCTVCRLAISVRFYFSGVSRATRFGCSPAAIIKRVVGSRSVQQIHVEFHSANTASTRVCMYTGTYIIYIYRAACIHYIYIA